MRLTLKLFYQFSKKYNPKYKFHTRDEWKNRGRKMNFPRAYIPPEVQKAIRPPEEMLTSLRYEAEIKKNTVIGYEDFLQYQKPDIKQLLIKEDPIKLVERPDAYMFNQYRRFEFGEQQASLITKTKVISSPFPHLHPAVLPDNVRQILERFILKANWWITDEDKFPKRFDRHHKLFRFKSEFGISIKNNIRYLLKDLFEYCDQIGDTDQFRMINKDHIVETFYNWNNRRIQFVETRDFVISHFEPLPIFEERPIKWKPGNYLKILGPVDPCVDLKIENHYPLDSCDGWTTSDVKFRHPHIITVNLDLPNVHTDFLEPEARQINQSQKNAIGIMNCFAQCIATARHLFGNEAVDQCREKLPHPICVHAIAFDGVQFDFISYQLNSTDFSDTACANLAWIDTKNDFFTKALLGSGMLRNTRYENMNLGVFIKFLQYFQFGLKNKS